MDNKDEKFAVVVDLKSGDIDASHFKFEPHKRQVRYTDLQKVLYKHTHDKMYVKQCAIASEIMMQFVATTAVMDSDTYKLLMNFADAIRDFKFKQAIKGN